MILTSITNLVISGMFVIINQPGADNCKCISNEAGKKCIVRQIEFKNKKYNQAVMFEDNEKRDLATGKVSILCYSDRYDDSDVKKSIPKQLR